MLLAEFLKDKIATVCPLHEIAIENSNDKSTWRIDYSMYATDAQKAAAKSIIEDFDLATAKEAIALWQRMTPTDQMMARMAEDLIVILVMKKLIAKTDLPTLPDGTQPIIEKINARRSLRGQPPL